MWSAGEDIGASQPDWTSPKIPSLDPDDPEMDSLTKMLDKSLQLQTRATGASRFVEVDNKHTLRVEVGPSDYYRLQAHYKRLNKRKRDEGTLPRSARGERVGYRPEELLWNGALDLKDCRPSNLTNDIHPIFGRDRFDDCPDVIYDQFQPALRLATMFLTKPCCFQFWVTLGLGKRTFDPDMSHRYGDYRERIERNVPLTRANATQMIRYIKELDPATLVHFSFKQVVARPDGVFAWAMTQEICDYRVERLQGGLKSRHVVKLHGDFYIAAEKLSHLAYPDPAAQLRFSFFLAVILLHELAHVVESAHAHGRHRYVEPFLFDHCIAEMGAAWESMMFGGRIQPINGKVDGTHGLSVNDWPGNDPREDPRQERLVYYSVPMGYIESMFQMKNWERDYNLKDWKRFHIPHDGAIALYNNIFTTMPWSEELREIEMTIAEDLSLLDPEEPARKRRETRTGVAVISTTNYGEEPEKKGDEEQRPPRRVRPGVKRPTKVPKSIRDRKHRDPPGQGEGGKAEGEKRVERDDEPTPMNDEKAEEGNKQINDEAAKEPEEGNTQMNDEPAEKPEEGNTQMNDEPAEKPEEGNTQMNDEPAEKPEVKTQEVVLQANENTSGQKKDHNPNEQSNEGTQEVTNKPVRVELYHRRIMQLKRLAKNAFFPIKWVSPPRSSEDVMTDSGELE